MTLTLELARSEGSLPLLVGAPHSTKTKAVLDQIGVTYEHREHLVDFVAVDRRAHNIDLPVVACESEVNPTHGVDYTFDVCPDTQRPKNGYVWDFRKLLYFRSPRLVFVARVNKGRSDGRARIMALERTLSSCAADYAAVWSGSRLDVLVLPNGRYESVLARIGTAHPNSCLEFGSLFV